MLRRYAAVRIDFYRIFTFYKHVLHFELFPSVPPYLYVYHLPNIIHILYPLLTMYDAMKSEDLHHDVEFRRSLAGPGKLVT